MHESKNDDDMDVTVFDSEKLTLVSFRYLLEQKRDYRNKSTVMLLQEIQRSLCSLKKCLEFHQKLYLFHHKEIVSFDHCHLQSLRKNVTIT